MSALLGVEDGSTQAEHSIFRTRHGLAIRRKTFTNIYVVHAEPSETTDDIITATGIPALYTLTSGAYLISLTPREVDGTARLWHVEGRFDSHIEVDDPDINPEDRTPKWEWDGETIDELLEKDAVTKDPIQNEVYEPIPITGPITLAILRITRFETSFSPNTLFFYQNHVNDQSFWGAPAGSALMAKIQDVPFPIDGTEYRQVTYTVKFKLKDDPDNLGVQLLADTWMAKPLHQGTRFKVSSGHTQVSSFMPFVDANGQPTIGNLREDGTKLASDEDPVFLEFNRFAKKDFNNLALGPFV